MLGLDSEGGDVITRLLGIVKGPPPGFPIRLGTSGMTSAGPREVLIAESAARELAATLTELLP